MLKYKNDKNMSCFQQNNAKTKFSQLPHMSVTRQTEMFRILQIV